MKESLESLRTEYGRSELSTDTVDPDPIGQFAVWFREAAEAGVQEPNAMTLCTASSSGTPSGRIVLLKDVTPDGFTFFTNYLSRKGSELEENPRASLVFWWKEQERQVRIEGDVQRLSIDASDAYFSVRPRGSRIGAWASPQSSVIPSREVLEERAREIEARFDGEIPRPDFWGGFLLKPRRLELWQGRPNRLHDRICYSRSEAYWKIERLAP
ncbi:MAG: pyridoxamine 5'-phosphate oxidase [Rhodothermia bacterium]|nr:pyridoxamine 5'-phosphate oxidase [Rhodothermia bacterium]